MNSKVFTIIGFLALIACGVQSGPLASPSTMVNVSARLVPKTDQFGIFNVVRNKKSRAALDELGVGWIRLQLQMGEDKKNLSQGLKLGYGLWLTLYHRDRGNAKEEGTVGFRKSERGGFPPRDKERYRRLVRQTVEPLVKMLRARGKDPADWLVVQFGNEVLPRDVHPPDKPVRFWHGTADEYLAMLALGYDTIKEIDSGIPVAAGGFSTLAMDAVIDGVEKVADWNRRILQEGRFDWVDVHLRGKYQDIPKKVGWIRKYWNGPIASSEFAGPDIRTGVKYSDELQAKELPIRMHLAIDSGVDRIFWSQLVDRIYSNEPQFHNEGLIRRNWTRKPSYDVYRRVIEKYMASPSPSGRT